MGYRIVALSDLQRHSPITSQNVISRAVQLASRVARSLGGSTVPVRSLSHL